MTFVLVANAQASLRKRETSDGASVAKGLAGLPEAGIGK